MGEIVSLPPVQREWFADSRGRSLRVSWHEPEHVIVCSLWEGERCIGTFHLDVADTPRMSILLSRAVANLLESVGDRAAAEQV